ncbi:CPXCG motif-containing cysteine-rich protein [Corallococcus carmarthensis]|uniref:CPXCG motif-containing cysteine-rich protein n=1 Tax=Corallococcus carmarthensis TaxID=2316728 RepID=A0A3A8K8H3_9BACT|nr:CPXCG motif-containing cysteine-rich protein [Corallococcus carmarthensis]NOK23114.1 CPXCG motif-containing cysteine-rich protein [Corallococcus carmarthensis]RKG98731.1 CPXCG motif-containing cysteine-rich protein [Corallococcus carmarthensis]
MQPFADAATQTCPYCGEEVEVDVDSLGASAESYVEDCPVCCRPWEVHVTRDEDGAVVTLGRDDD